MSTLVHLSTMVVTVVTLAAITIEPLRARRFARRVALAPGRRRPIRR